MRLITLLIIHTLQADRLAAGFQSIGLNIGDRIGLMAPNCINWYVTMMAAVRAGLILVGIQTILK